MVTLTEHQPLCSAGKPRHRRVAGSTVEGSNVDWSTMQFHARLELFTDWIQLRGHMLPTLVYGVHIRGGRHNLQFPQMTSHIRYEYFITMLFDTSGMKWHHFLHHFMRKDRLRCQNLGEIQVVNQAQKQKSHCLPVCDMSAALLSMLLSSMSLSSHLNSAQAKSCYEAEKLFCGAFPVAALMYDFRQKAW